MNSLEQYRLGFKFMWIGTITGLFLTFIAYSINLPYHIVIPSSILAIGGFIMCITEPIPNTPSHKSISNSDNNTNDEVKQ